MHKIIDNVIVGPCKGKSMIKIHEYTVEIGTRFGSAPTEGRCGELES
jgi:hypothetical protein